MELCKDTIAMIGYALLLVFGSVFFLLLARPVILVVCVLVFAAAVISVFSRRFRIWFEALGEH